MTFLLHFNDLEFSKSSLFCCNGYRHEIFAILFYENKSRISKKSIYIRNKNKKALMIFLLLFYYIFMNRS